MEDALQDNDRVNYFKGITNALKNAMLEDGVDVRAYFPWSMYCSHFIKMKFSYISVLLLHEGFVDNFEW